MSFALLTELICPLIKTADGCVAQVWHVSNNMEAQLVVQDSKLGNLYTDGTLMKGTMHW